MSEKVTLSFNRLQRVADDRLRVNVKRSDGTYASAFMSRLEYEAIVESGMVTIYTEVTVTADIEPSKSNPKFMNAYIMEWGDDFHDTTKSPFGKLPAWDRLPKSEYADTPRSERPIVTIG